jgi:predicted nucleotidyltransferase
LAGVSFRKSDILDSNDAKYIIKGDYNDRTILSRFHTRRQIVRWSVRIESHEMIAGKALIKIRDFLKRNRLCNWSDTDVVRSFDTNYKKARDIISELEARGYIEQITIGKDTYWQNTLKGNSLSLATSAKPILRSTADKKIKEFMERVVMVNKEKYFLYKVTKVVLFGSYLGNKEKINDIDISITLVPKDENAERQRALNLERTNEAIAEGRRFNNIVEQLYWPQYEVVKFLKARSKSISLHQDEDLLKRCKYKVIYKKSQ